MVYCYAIIFICFFTNLVYKGELMADVSLNPNEKKVYDAIKKLGATSEDKVKSADDIMKAAGVGKAIVTSALQTLATKGYVKRVARAKSAGYYVLK